MRCGLYIFSRFDSRRLPGKALRLIAGRPMLGHVIDRARRVRHIDDIIVATSDRDIDDPIIEFAGNEGVNVFRGALDDVAGRALACAEAYGHKLFVRISGDSPFFDHILASQLVDQAKIVKTDIVTNINPRTFPPGTSVEVITVEAMKRVVNATKESSDREHVTQYIYKHPDLFNIFNVENDDNAVDGISLVVDTPSDLERAEWIASAYCQTSLPNKSLSEIIARARSWTHGNYREQARNDEHQDVHDH
jgi:spore coat polysaccharide biosynthesis protein SpsF